MTRGIRGLTTTDGLVLNLSIEDEIAAESQLRNHADVFWCPKWDTEANIRPYWTRIATNYPDFGTVQKELITWPDFDNIPAMRIYGQWTGNNPFGSDIASTMNWHVAICSSTKPSWMNITSGGIAGILANPISEMWFRQVVVFQDMTNFFGLANKLSGLAAKESGSLNQVTSTFQQYGPTAGSGNPGNNALMTYWTVPQVWPNSFNFPVDVFETEGLNLSTPPVNPWMPIGEPVSLEVHIKLNTRNPDGTFNADGQYHLWIDDVLFFSLENAVLTRAPAPELIEINYLHGQLFHGGNPSAALLPPAPCIWQYSGFAMANRRIGKIKRSSARLVQNINNSSWAGFANTNDTPSSGWAQTGADGQVQIVDHEFATGFTHSNGRQLEFCTSNAVELDGITPRRNGNNTGVRWAHFHSHGAPWQGYYWPNNDPLIYEIDNFGTFYLPWKQWVILQNLKIIDIATPAAIDRWPDAPAALSASTNGSILTHFSVIDYVNQSTVSETSWQASVNPCCDQNPGNSTFTFNYGGGYFISYPNGRPTLLRVVDNNPFYPSTSSKPLRMRIIEKATAVSPTHMHSGVRVGNYFYWGGTNIHNAGNGTSITGQLNKFYRLNLASIQNGVIDQEPITDCIMQASSVFGESDFAGGWKYGLMCADTYRGKLIFINGQGVFVYTIPIDEGTDGVWSGPYTFGMTTTQWASTISDGHIDLTANGSLNSAGFIGTHRSDMNKTFFRYNRSNKWNRIDWP